MDSDVIDVLSTGDKRTVNNVDSAVEMLQARPTLIPAIIAVVQAGDEALAMRAADCIEKLSRQRPELLQPHIAELMAALDGNEQKEVRWHLAQMLPRLSLTAADLATALQAWSDDFYHAGSSILRAASLQAVYDISSRGRAAAQALNGMIPYALEQGTPAMQARARQLMKNNKRS